MDRQPLAGLILEVPVRVRELPQQCELAEKILMTTKGAERLREQLKSLKSHGDGEDEEARDVIDAEISRLEGTLALAEVVDPAQLTGSRVQFGSTVVLVDHEGGRTQRLQIVGEHEADAKNGLVSLSARLGSVAKVDLVR